MNVLTRGFVALLALTAPGVALAHPGHGGFDAHQSLHLVLDHPVLVIAALAVAVIGSGVALRRALDRRRSDS